MPALPTFSQARPLESPVIRVLPREGTRAPPVHHRSSQLPSGTMRVRLVAYARCTHPGCHEEGRADNVTSPAHGETALRLLGWRWSVENHGDLRQGWVCPNHAYKPAQEVR